MKTSADFCDPLRSNHAPSHPAIFFGNFFSGLFEVARHYKKSPCPYGVVKVSVIDVDLVFNIDVSNIDDDFGLVVVLTVWKINDKFFVVRTILFEVGKVDRGDFLKAFANLSINGNSAISEEVVSS